MSRALLLLIACGCNHAPLDAMAGADLAQVADLSVAPSCGGAVCCRSQNECAKGPNFEICLPPGEWAGCGICIAGSPCQSDSECSNADAGSYPEWGHTCDWGNSYQICAGCFQSKICLRGCDGDSDCRTGQRCDATRHCVTRTCGSAADCPLQFQCSGGFCQRPSCSSDGDCPGGFCVNAVCYPSLGSCVIGPV